MKSQSPNCNLRPQGLTPTSRHAFTLVELLVVIGIIVILIGILVPTVGAVRRASYGAKTQSIMSQLSTAAEAYYQDFRAYPGPLANDQIGPAPFLATGITGATRDITMSENLFLGLSGGLYDQTDASGTVTALVVDPANSFLKGPRTLTPVGAQANNTNRIHPPYIENIATSWDLPRPLNAPQGRFQDDVAAANDTIIPEYIDGYPNPLPILYMRAKVGAPGTGATRNNNPVCTYGVGTRPGAYDISQVIGYTGPDASGNYIGEGKDKSKANLYVASTAFPAHGLNTINFNLEGSMQKSPTSPLFYQYPYDLYAFLGAPNYFDTGTNKFTQPRQRDGFILISAGPDRIYGTEDDICSFGAIFPQ